MNASQLTAATTKVLHAVQTAQEQYGLFPVSDTGPRPVVIGVSGGADSVCLLHVLVQVAETWQIDLHIAHLDHGLRPDSAADTRLVQRLAQETGLPFHAETLPPGSLTAHDGGLEDAARRARYAFLCRVATHVTPKSCTPTVAVAHHADDQAETVLMHLIGGGGLHGLGAMRWISEIDEARFAQPHQSDRSYGPDEKLQTVRLVRPFLTLARQELRDYLSAIGWPWREDVTNLDTTRLRNRIRHVILPLLSESNPNVTATLGRTAQILAAEADRTTALDRNHLARLLVEHTPAQRLVFDLAGWRDLPLAAQRGVLRLALEQWGLDLRTAGFDHVETLVWRLRTEATTGGPLFFLDRLFWSIGTDGKQDGPALLSFHDKDVLPFRPRHPLLPNAWEQPQTVPVPGRLDVDGWRLETDLVPATSILDRLGDRQDPWRAYLDMAQSDGLVLRCPQRGDRFSPFGLDGHSKQLGDFFTDRKIPPALRSRWPLVVDAISGRILWVSGLEIDHMARITPNTQTAIHLNWENSLMQTTATVEQRQKSEQCLPTSNH